MEKFGSKHVHFWNTWIYIFNCSLVGIACIYLPTLSSTHNKILSYVYIYSIKIISHLKFSYLKMKLSVFHVNWSFMFIRNFIWDSISLVGLIRSPRHLRKGVQGPWEGERSLSPSRRRKGQMIFSTFLCFSQYNNVSFSKTCFPLTRSLWLILLSKDAYYGSGSSSVQFSSVTQSCLREAH